MTTISRSAESTYSALTEIQAILTRRVERQLRDATQVFDEATAALQTCRADVQRADEKLLQYQRSAAARTAARAVVDAQNLHLAREQVRSLARAADGSRQRYDVQAREVAAKSEHCADWRRRLAASHARAEVMKALSTKAQAARSELVEDAEEDESAQAHLARRYSATHQAV